jgi:hypothetical protein
MTTAVEIKKFKEAALVADFKRLCEASLPPDAFDILVDNIIPTLVANRHIIDWDLVKVIDCRYWICDMSGDKVRMLTDSECAEYIWGKGEADLLADCLQECIDSWPADGGPLGAEKAYCRAENLLKLRTER